MYDIACMTKILHTADIHLKEYNDERWQAVEELLRVAAKNKADALTIAGDLFDKDIHSQQLRDKLRVLFSRQSFQVIILPGNHDVLSYDAGEFFGENVTIITNHKKTVQVKNTSIAGIPFASLTSSQLAAQIEEASRTVDEKQPSILLIHAELIDVFFSSADFGEEGNKRYLPLKLSMFDQSPFDYLLAGHFHTRFQVKRLSNKKMSGGGYFLYPGSPVSITTKEIGPRSAGLIEIGKAPEQINVETSFYQPIKLTLKPDNDQSIIADLQAQLARLPALATGLIEVNGFFDRNQLQLTEQELYQKIKALAGQHHSQLREQDFIVKDISSIINSDLYQTLINMIQERTEREQESDHLSNILTTALSR